MTSPSRAAQFTKLHRALKKIYKPVSPGDRPVLEHLLFACCLENAHYEKAEEAFGALVHNFFDWNEIRVTTIKELSEVMSALPDAAPAATHIKRILQQVFEATYSYDLDDLRKKNLGPAVERLQAIPGMSKFAVAYVIQSSLGGHCIPLDRGAMQVLRILDMASDEDVENQTVPGLERAIPKNKGVEFGSLLHQLAADFVANPYAPALHRTLLSIAPDAAGRLPKRRPRESKDEAAAAAPPTTVARKPSPDKSAAPVEEKAPAPAEKSKKKPKAEPPVEEKAKRKKDAKPAPRPAERKKPKAAEKKGPGLSKRKPR